MSDVSDRSQLIVSKNLSSKGGKTSRPGRGRRLLSSAAEVIVRRLRTFSEETSVDVQWPRALCALALARAAETGDKSALSRLIEYADTLLTPHGRWRAQLESPPQALDGYDLVILHRLAPSERYDTAIRAMASHFLNDSPRLGGCLPYSRSGNLMLVDTLGMLCPFLAAYGRDFKDARATELAKAQLQEFIDRNLDPSSYLPFHGYFAGGPYRLGAHAWGRGVGWYMLGLADTLIELDPAEKGYPELKQALSQAAQALQGLQRPDGNWGWAIVLPETRNDTSVASFCGYALARARHANLIPAGHDHMIARALAALNAASGPDGTVGNSSGECRGLTDYSRTFGPQPWVQGTAAAFVIEMRKEPRNTP
jgi:unsaturated rhamnogalacturonyl hydrolase